MPDPSGDPPHSQDKTPGIPRRTVSANPPEPLAPAPRIHPPHAHQPRKAQKTTVTPPSDLAQVLDWMKQNGHLPDRARVAAEDAPRDETTARLHLPKEQRKFHKFDPEHPTPQPHLREEVEGRLTDDLDEDTADATPLRGLSTDQIVRLGQMRHGSPNYGLWLAVGVSVMVFSAVAAAFLLNHTTLGQWFSPKNASPDPTMTGMSMPLETSAAVMALIDESTVAENARDYATAIDRLERVQHEGKHVYGLDYHLAALYLRANNGARAIPLLNRSILEGEQVAASCNLRGLLASQSGAADQGLPDLAKATQIDPFNARYFFDWGEALRRAGDPRSALPQLQRAANRLQDSSRASAYSLKIRLTELELGQEDTFVDELAARLKQTPPPADWLVTAAAVEMRRSDFPAAADYLSKLSATLGEHETMKQLQDVYFAPFAHEKPLVKFYEGSVPPSTVTLP